jgi:hypothetical protein
MKKRIVLFLLVAPLLAPACEGVFSEDPKEKGSIVLSFSNSAFRQTKSSSENIPDSADFLLSVTSSKGDTAYSGKYGDSPQRIEVDPGLWKVSVRSGKFTRPKFAEPLYGDDQDVSVASGGTSRVRLTCRQVNCGIRLHINSNFLTSFPDGAIFVGSDDGRLLYSYGEKRIAYFRPGPVSVLLDENVSDYEPVKNLFTRTLAPCEILNVSISAPEGSGKTSIDMISVDIDTTRNWTDIGYEIGDGTVDDGGAGGNGSGGSQADAMDVAKAKASVGKENVWIYGYIVGCFRSSRSALSDEPPFSISTNLAIASRKSVTGKEECIAVQLPAGDVREGLNLVDNESNLGRKVFLKGDIVASYMGTVGLQGVSDFMLQ